MADADQHDPDDRPLVLDELVASFERFRLLRKSDESATDALLDELGARSQVDRDIVLELSATEPLGQPQRFVEAHCLAMRSIEALDRNGARPVTITARIGPLRPIAAALVGLVCKFIVRSHQGSVIDHVTDLYDRRLAWTPNLHPDRLPLMWADRQAHRVQDGYKTKPVGVPTFLVGGAAASGLGSGLQYVTDAAFGTTVGRIFTVAVVFLLLAAVAWIVVRGAAAARRRIKLTVEQPMAALWETVGRCGKPPKDPSRQFAIYAIALTAVGWLVIPAGILFVISQL